MRPGKVIKLFLIDGTANGMQTCEISNWTGKAIKVPRKLILLAGKRPELSRTGVYFLFGKDVEDPDQDAVYIGEGEDVYRRLVSHQSKEFWTEAVVFVSKDENLNKAHVKFLESELFKQAKAVGRYRLDNTNVPTHPKVGETDQAEMVEFVENLKTIVDTLGYKLFVPLTSKGAVSSPEYFLKAARGADAKAVLTGEGIVVLKSSTIATSTVKSVGDWAKNQRQKLIEKKIIVKDQDRLVLSKDHLFSSPSAAASVVTGTSINGRVAWKDRHGKSIKQNEGS